MVFIQKLLSFFDIVVAVIILVPLNGFFDVLFTVLGAAYFGYKFWRYPKLFRLLDGFLGVYVLLTIWFFPIWTHLVIAGILVIRGFVRAIF